MLMVRTKFKNIINSKQKQNLRMDVEDIKDNDTIYVMQNGYFLHERTNKYGFLLDYLDNIEHMKKEMRKIFDQWYIFNVPTTDLQQQHLEAKSSMPQIVEEHKNLFVSLLEMNRRYNISIKLIATILQINNTEAKMIIKNGIKYNIFKKGFSSWCIPPEVWNHIKLAFMVKPDKGDMSTPDDYKKNEEKQWTSMLGRKYPDLYAAYTCGTKTKKEIDNIIRKRDSRKQQSLQSHKLQQSQNPTKAVSATVDHFKTIDSTKEKV